MSVFAASVQGSSCRVAQTFAGRSLPALVRVQRSVTAAILLSSPAVASAIPIKPLSAVTSRGFAVRAVQPICAASATMEAAPPAAENPLLQVNRRNGTLSLHSLTLCNAAAYLDPAYNETRMQQAVTHMKHAAICALFVTFSAIALCRRLNFRSMTRSKPSTWCLASGLCWSS